MTTISKTRILVMLGLPAALAAIPAPASIIYTAADQQFVSTTGADITTTIGSFTTFSGDDVYIGFDVDWSTGSVGNNDFFVLWFDGNGSQNIGIKGNSGPLGRDYIVRHSSGDTGAYSPVQVNIPTNNIRLVGHLEKTTSGPTQPYSKFSLWVDPANNPDAVATTNASGDASIGTLGKREVNKDADDTVWFRDIKVATTFEEASNGVSEPPPPPPPPLFIPPGGFTATASSSYPTSNRVPSVAVNGAGMIDDDTHASNDFGDNISWMANAGDLAGWFKVDLGQDYMLDHAKVWNFNANSGRTDRGVQGVDVYYSSADADPGSDFGVGWTLLGNFTLTKAPGNSSYNTPDVIDFGGATAHWVAFDILSNYGGSFVGLSEVRFYGTIPEPATLLIWSLLAGLGVGLRWRRKR